MASSAWVMRESAALDWKSTQAVANLHLTHNLAIPSPGPNQVLVRLHAAALNARDIKVLAHNPVYPDIAQPDLSPCCDGAGLVQATGPGSSWAIGDRVLLCPSNWISGEVDSLTKLSLLGSGGTHGTLREHLVVDDKLLIRAPSHLSWEECAALPTTAGTVWNAFFGSPRRLEPGMTVLTQGTGGVATAAVQIAAAIGATVIATSSSAAKLDAASRLGATHVVNYRETPDWGNEVLRLTGGCGVDFVVDVVGPATLVQSLRATRRWGVVFVVGILSGDQPVEVLELIRKKGVAVQGIFMFSREHIEAAVGLYEEHALRPLVGRAFEYGEAKAAFEALVAQETLGKIVVRI